MNNGKMVTGSFEEGTDFGAGSAVEAGDRVKALKSWPFEPETPGKRFFIRKYDKSLTALTVEKIEEVKKFIHKNYLEDISREGLAAAFCLSPDHLGRMFLRHTGKRIGAYICRLRIHEASRRLLSTDDGIIRIAHDTGFESLRSFNRAFYERMGITPSEYRRLRRK